MSNDFAPVRAAIQLGGLGGNRWYGCDIIEYGNWYKDREGKPWQAISVFIPPFQGRHLTGSDKLKPYKEINT